MGTVTYAEEGCEVSRIRSVEACVEHLAQYALSIVPGGDKAWVATATVGQRGTELEFSQAMM